MALDEAGPASPSVRRSWSGEISTTGDVLILPRFGQFIWIAIIAALYIRVTLVIAGREELLENLNPKR